MIGFHVHMSRLSTSTIFAHNKFINNFKLYKKNILKTQIGNLLNNHLHLNRGNNSQLLSNNINAFLFL